MSGDLPRKNIILTQLPHPSCVDRNVPLAAGYLKASAYIHSLLEKVDIEILDPIVSDYSGCQRLINTIISKKPDVLGFSLYLWNVERTLYIIEMIKTKMPHLKIIVGGPEVSNDSIYILSNPNIDIAIIGEGEVTFVEVINNILSGRPELDKIAGICYRKNNNIVVNKPRKRITDLELIPSPYILGFIDYRKYREMMLFTMKGCLLGCTYCSWTARGKLRAFTIGRLQKELTLAMKTGEETIVSIIDSAFNTSPVFVEFCKMIRELNNDKNLKFTCFVQADLVDEETARLLKESNFTSVEVGLQSTNPKILAKINRSMDIGKFLKGIQFLKKEGIQVKVDTILGLPGDSFTTFEETMNFISHNRLDPIIFNLSLGHGAELRHHAKEFGAKVQTAPPFYVLETNTFSRQEFEKALDHYKEYSADFDKIINLNYPSINYNTGNNDRLYLHNIDYPISSIIIKLNASSKSSDDVNKLAEMISQKIGSNLSILFLGNNKNLTNSLWLIRILLTQISSKNPYITWNIFLEIEDYDQSQEFLEEIISFIQKPKVFLDYRNELFAKSISCVRGKSVNIFVLPCINDIKDPNVNESNCIKIVNITDQNTIQYQVQQLVQTKGSGFLIDIPKESDLDFIKKAMSLLSASGKNIFYKDWVLQRLWEQEILKITPKKQTYRYELIIDKDLNLYGKFFDENELLWDSVIKWKMLKSEFANQDVEKIIIDRIVADFQQEEMYINGP